MAPRLSNHHDDGWNGGKGTRTPDIQLAKLALYQLSYAPVVGSLNVRSAVVMCAARFSLLPFLPVRFRHST